MLKKNTALRPDDVAFRQFLTWPEIARDFMEIHLPEELRTVCDFSTLKAEPCSLIEENFRQYFSDVLYSLETAGGPGYVHVLIEHRRSPDSHMAFRMTRYALAVMQRHLEAGHRKLPLVIPVLLYIGQHGPYPCSTRWLDEFDDPALAGGVYSRTYPLIDVTVLPDDEIMAHRSMAALTLLQKNIHQCDIAALTGRLATLMTEENLSSPLVASLTHYLLQTGESADAEAFVRELVHRVPQHGNAIMTIAKQLEQKGIDKGIEKGIKQGIEEGVLLGEKRGIEKGEREATLKIARTMLQNGLNRSTVMKMTALTVAELAQISY